MSSLFGLFFQFASQIESNEIGSFHCQNLLPQYGSLLFYSWHFPPQKQENILQGVCVCVCTCIHVCVCACMHRCTHVHTYIFFKVVSVILGLNLCSEIFISIICSQSFQSLSFFPVYVWENFLNLFFASLVLL